MSGRDTRIRIWSNLDEFMIWEHNNCACCVRRNDCAISDAISDASYGDGALAPEMAVRMGHNGTPTFWCAEHQPAHPVSAGGGVTVS